MLALYMSIAILGPFRDSESRLKRSFRRLGKIVRGLVLWKGVYPGPKNGHCQHLLAICMVGHAISHVAGAAWARRSWFGPSYKNIRNCVKVFWDRPARHGDSFNVLCLCRRVGGGGGGGGGGEVGPSATMRLCC